MHIQKNVDSGELSLSKPVFREPPGDHPAYLGEGIQRIAVPEDRVAWNIQFPEYDDFIQRHFDHPAVLREYQKNGDAGWAAAPDAKALLGMSPGYEEHQVTDASGELLNPAGRTGIKSGRGLLGKPGPNLAVDAIILRIDPTSGELQVLLIRRRDTGALALPGGMLNRQEHPRAALSRELVEETGIDLEMQSAIKVYAGYVADPRNTDRAWIETYAALKLLVGSEVHLPIQAGDDALEVVWQRVDGSLRHSLYGSHAFCLRLALELIPVHFSDELQSVATQVALAREELLQD
jgi:ADP-ribose pyrophosphatase